MNGWLILILLAGLLGGGLIVAARPARGAALLISAGIAIAFAGYAAQGRPGLGGKPTRPQDAPRLPDDLFASEHAAMLGSVGRDAELLDAADRLIARGDTDYAIATIRAGLVRAPRSVALWIGLGNGLVRYAGGQMTPPARFAYDRAAMLAPGHPAPRYFLGLAYAAAGDLATADTIWTALASTPIADERMRMRVFARLFLLRRIESQNIDH